MNLTTKFAAGLLMLALLLAGCDAVTGLFGDQQKKVLETYESYRQAVEAGDLALLKKHVVQSRTRELEAPEAEAGLSAIRAMRPKEARIVATSVRSGAATLTLTAPAEGGTARGTIELLKESGRWKVDKESWQLDFKLAGPSGQQAEPAQDKGRPRRNAERPTNFREFRGQWKGTEPGRSGEWLVSFGDDFEMSVQMPSGEVFRGDAEIRSDLGAERDGMIRVPPGSTPIDLLIEQGPRPEHAGAYLLGAYMKRGKELSACIGAPGGKQRAKSFDDAGAELRCFSLALADAEPVGSVRPKTAPAEAAPSAPASPPALTEAQEKQFAQMAQREREEAARDAKGEARLAFDGANAQWTLKRGFRFQTRFKDPKRAVVHFGPEVVQNSYHGIVLIFDATRTGRHNADGAGINAELFENKPYVIGEPVQDGTRASIAYYADGGQMYPPKVACTLRLESAYTGKPDSLLAGEMAECLVFSAGIEHRITGLKFSMRGISLR